MAKRLTKKQKDFVNDFVKTGSVTQSALNNYDVKDGKVSKERVAEAIGSENLSKPIIQEAIKSIADQIPDKLLVKKHLALLNKEEVVTKNNMTTGEVDVIETGQIDAQAVAKGLDMAYKLKGTYAPEEKNVTLRAEKLLEIQESLKAVLHE